MVSRAITLAFIFKEEMIFVYLCTGTYVACFLQLEYWNQAFIHTLNNDVSVFPKGRSLVASSESHQLHSKTVQNTINVSCVNSRRVHTVYITAARHLKKILFFFFFLIGSQHLH